MATILDDLKDGAMLAAAGRRVDTGLAHAFEALDHDARRPAQTETIPSRNVACVS